MRGKAMGRPPAYEGFAAAAPGTETLVEAELRGLGLIGIESLAGGISFKASALDLCRVNLYSRVANRVLVRVARFNAGGYSEFERRIKRVEWDLWLPPATPVRVKAVAAKTKMNHTGRLEELVLAAIEAKLGEVPDIAAATPKGGDEGANSPLTVYLRVRREKITVSLDTSGEHLHRRGYRSHSGDAPLRENLAAACLIAMGYDGSMQLVDPCCGSGTFAVEAALIATNTPPGLFRGFAFERLPLFDPEGWGELREQAEALRRKAGVAPIFGSDIDPDVLPLAERAAHSAGVGAAVKFSAAAMDELDAGALDMGSGGFLIANPPYGLRLKGEARAYSALARMIAGAFSGWRWGVIVCRKREAAKLRVTGQKSLDFIGAGLPLEFRMGGLPE